MLLSPTSQVTIRFSCQVSWVNLYLPWCESSGESKSKEIRRKLYIFSIVAHSRNGKQLFPYAARVHNNLLRLLLICPFLNVLLLFKNAYSLVVATGCDNLSEFWVGPWDTPHRTLMPAYHMSTSPFLGSVHCRNSLELFSPDPNPEHLIWAASGNPFTIKVELNIVHKVIVLKTERRQ